MPSKAPTPWKDYLSWRFCLALLFSLLLHVLVINDLSFMALPATEPVPETLDARLVPLQPKPLQKVVAKPAKQASKPRPAPVQEAPAAVPRTEPLPVIEGVQEPEALPPLVEDAAEATEEPAGEDVVEAGAVRPQSAGYIEADFELKRSVNGDTVAGTVGEAHISYKADTNGRYSIKSVARAKGFASLFVSGQLRQESEGRVTDKGLQPERFLYQYGDDEAKAQRAKFDWAGGELYMESAKGKTSARLVPGTQDMLSFMYQFMFTPPLEEMSLSVTNGKRLRTYDYSFEGEEQLSTKMGNFRTIHIAKSSADGKDKTEVWLAMDYQYIPVKIRKTEDSGNVIEQIVTRLSTDILK
jgi:hypothetical protein